MRRAPGRTSRGRARRPWPRRSRAGFPPRSRPASSRAARSARPDRRATIRGRCAPGRRRRRGGADGGARRRSRAGRRRSPGVSGSGGKISTGRGAAGRCQPVAGALKAAAISVAPFSGMWLSAGCSRTSASSPSRAPSRPRRSAMPSASPPGWRVAAAAATASWPRCWRGPSGSTTIAFEPDHLDAEAGVDLAELQRQQRPDRLRPVGGAREPDLAQLGLSVGADQRQPHPPRALAGGGEPVAERRQQPVDAGEDVRLEPDRLGEASAAARRHAAAAPARPAPARGRAPGRAAAAPPARPAGRAAPAACRHEVDDPAEAERLQRRELGGIEPERRHRQRADMRAASRPAARSAGRARRQCRGRRRSAAALPAPLLRPRAGGARLLVDGVAGMRREGCRRRHSAPPPRPRPGCRRAPSRSVSPKLRRLRLDLGDEPRLAAEEPGAAGDVEHQRLGAFLGHPGGEAPGPAPQRGEEGGFAHGILGPGHQPGQIARASPSAMPRRSPAASAAAVRLASTSAPRALGHHRQRRLGELAARPAAPARRRGGETRARGCGAAARTRRLG